jgi:hypothetical protein
LLLLSGGILCVAFFIMKTLYKPVLLFIPLLALLGIHSIRSQIPNAQQGLASPTPTYDPFVEPPLPTNPTEYELGRDVYWHWCMPCHGDRGQGLTDEFRGMWEPDHQNCWARGCHTGRREDQGFPIPTVVPALVGADHLTQFSSVQELADFLKATHPPQSPGILKDEEYHAIALFVFTMDGRLPVDITPASTPTEILVPPQKPIASSYLLSITLLVVSIVSALVIFVLVRRPRHQGKDNVA